MKNIKTIFTIIFLFISLKDFPSQINYFSSLSQNLLDGSPNGVVVFEDGTFLPDIDFGEPVSISGNPITVQFWNGTFYLGSTSESSLLKIENGKVEKLASFEEAMVSAIAVSKDKIFAGTSTPSKLYEVSLKGEKKLVKSFDNGLITFIKILESGDLIVGAGNPGTIFIISIQGEIKKEIKIDANIANSIFKIGSKFYLGTSSPATFYEMDSNLKLTLISTFDYEEVSDIDTCDGKILFSLNAKKDENKNAKIMEYSESGGIREIFSRKGVFTSIRSSQSGVYFALNDGLLFFYNGKKVGLSKKFDRQLSRLSKDNSDFLVAFSSPPSFSLPLRSEKKYYISPIIDTGGISRVGSVRYEADPLEKIYIRGGNKIPVDATWSDWVFVDQITNLSPFRYFQWKIDFSQKIDIFKGLTIAVKQLNRPPQFDDVKVHPPGEIYVKNISQIGDRLVSDIHSKERPFPEIAQSRPFDSGNQTFYLYGFRMISFNIKDPDGDIIKTKIELFPKNSKDGFILSDDVDGNFFVFDARTLPDGVYKVRITASDIKSNSLEDAKESVYEIPYLEIDNTPPDIVLTEDSGYLVYRVKDATSIRSSRVSKNGEMWKVIQPEGSQFGSKEETFKVKIESQDKWIVFQSVDGYGNMSNASWVK
jgi:hypothetical protein